MENVQFMKIGFQNFVSVNRVIAIVSSDSSPVKRIIQDARDRGSLIDATSGRKTRSVLIMDSDHIVLSAMTTEALNRDSLLTIEEEHE